MTADGGRKRAVLLGAGHAHLHTLKRAGDFARRNHDLVVVAPDAFWYSGLATGMLGGAYPPELDRVDVAALVARGGGRLMRDRAVGFDLTKRLVHLERHDSLRFDVLSLDVGSEAPAIPGDGGPGIYAVKPIRRVWHLRRDLERRFRTDPRDPVRVVVAGGGVTACELAANILALSRRNGGRAELTIVSGRGRPLSQLPEAAAETVVRRLREGGAVFAGGRVARIEDHRAILDDGGSHPFDVFVNATGLKPAGIVAATGLPTGPEGALEVDAFLRSPADPAVFAAGDCAAYRGRRLAKIGVHAIREAPVLHRNLLATLDGADLQCFEPQKRFLWIMNLGDGTGLAMRGRLWWRGRSAFRLKDWIDRRFLREYQDAAAGRA